MPTKKTKIKKTLKTLTISRKKWGKYALLTKQSKMCCLGFACRAIGYDLEKSAVDAFGNLATMPDELENFAGPAWMKSEAAFEASRANDELNGKKRENEVKAIFAKHGTKVRFVK